MTLLRRLDIQKRVDPYLVALLLLMVFALSPLMQPGYFWGAHDARHSVYFLFEFDRSIQDGILYPRWSPDFTFGYGYPFFNIYAPLPFYVGEAFHLLGFGFVDAVKIVFGLSIFLSGLGMYGFLRRLFGRHAALLGALTYVYAPYHLFDLYVRAALSESVALAFIPLVLWGFQEALMRPRIAAIATAGLAYAGLMFSSNLIALMFTPILALYVCALIVRRMHGEQPFNALSRESLLPLVGNFIHYAMPPLLAIGIGLGLSAIFWLPAILESPFVRADQWLAGDYDYHDDFVYLHQLVSPYWGFGTSGSGPNDGVGFQLGAVPLALSLLSLGALRGIRRREARWLVIFMQATLVSVVFMTLRSSVWVWESISLARFAQFPWRYFSLALPPLAILAGSVLAGEHEQPEAPAGWPRWVALATLIAALLLSSFPYIQAEIQEPAEGPVSLAGLMRFQHMADEMTGSTIWTKEIPAWSPMADVFMLGEDVTTKVDYSWVPQNETLSVDSRELNSVREKVWVWAGDDEQTVRFYRFYYPGWNAYILDEETGQVLYEAEIETTGPQGLITVPVPQGRHFLLLQFEDTLVRIVGKIMSGLTLAGLIALFVLRHALGFGGGRRHA
jgi:hypothetical protein